MVALLRAGGRAWARFVVRARNAGGASAVDPRVALEEELGLLAYESLAAASADLDRWRAQGMTVLTLRDRDYPANLAVVPTRPPLLFVSGAITATDARAVAVIGSREASGPGRASARAVAGELTAAGFTVVSGLAAGIDAEVHRAAMDAGGRTLAVIGTGHDHSYPSENRELQAEIAARGAVISQFWPETEPSQQTFPARNAVMAAITLASVIVEASARSGTRIQARHALEHGRTVVLMRPVMNNDWAQEMSGRPGVHVAETPADVTAALRV
jgi:DNA processing protein